jgi:MFS family permease
MRTETVGNQGQTPQLPNGAGSAAILAAGSASFMMAVLAILADHSPVFKKLMIFYTPTGPLSGVTTTAIAIWLLSWVVLDIGWRRRNVNEVIVPIGLCLFAIGFLLMFPPIGDLF